MKKRIWLLTAWAILAGAGMMALSCGTGSGQSDPETILPQPIERTTVETALSQIDDPQGTVTEERINRLVQMLAEGIPSLNLFGAATRTGRADSLARSVRAVDVCLIMEAAGIIDYMQALLSQDCTISCSSSGNEEYSLEFSDCTTAGRSMNGSLIMKVQALDYYTFTMEVDAGDCAIAGKGALYVPNLLSPTYAAIYFSYKMTCGNDVYDYEGGIRVDFASSSIQEFYATEEGDILTYEVDLEVGQVTIVGNNGDTSCFVTVEYDTETCQWTVLANTCGLSLESGNYCQ